MNNIYEITIDLRYNIFILNFVLHIKLIKSDVSFMCKFKFLAAGV